MEYQENNICIMTGSEDNCARVQRKEKGYDAHILILIS